MTSEKVQYIACCTFVRVLQIFFSNTYKKIHSFSYILIISVIGIYTHKGGNHDKTHR